jgi:hypothetical protein
LTRFHDITAYVKNCEEKLAFSGYALTGSGHRFIDRTNTAGACNKVETKYHGRFTSVNLKT